MDFNHTINRKNTNSLKHDFHLKRNKPADLLPLWVADMDFQAPKEIIEALHNVVNHGVFGYSSTTPAYYEILNNWTTSKYNYPIKAEWVVKTPGIVYAIALAVKAYTNKGDSIIIQSPVYYPFSEVILDNDRNLINNSLVYQDGRYSIDFEDFEEKIIVNNVKMFLFCSPHNPVGRVWSKEEITKLTDICIKHQVLIIADEIHADFVFKNKHIPVATISDKVADITITCMSPSKSFNIAGLQISNIIIKNEELRTKFRLEKNRSGYSQVGIMGITACEVAYTQCDYWLDNVKEYIQENILFLKKFINEKLPMLHVIDTEGTYLVWVDFSALNLSVEDLEDLIINKARLWLDSGKIFGNDGNGFQRFNVACSREVLTQALTQLETAILSLK